MHFQISRSLGPRYLLIPAFLGLALSFALGLSNSILFYELLPHTADAEIIVFYQPACPHCIAEIPVIRELSQKYRVSSINVLENPDLARKYGVTATPTIYIPSTGSKIVGEADYNKIVEALEKKGEWEGFSCSLENTCSPT